MCAYRHFRHGKSSFWDFYHLTNAFENDVVTSWFAPEHNPISYHLLKQAALFWGRAAFREDIPEGDECDMLKREDLEIFGELTRELCYYTKPPVIPDWKWLLDNIKEQIFGFGAKNIIVDAWNKVKLDGSGKVAIDSALAEITDFCGLNNVQIHVIVHPVKMYAEQGKKQPMAGLDHCSGSGDFRNQTHNGSTTYLDKFEGEIDENGRPKAWMTTVMGLKLKMKFQGYSGKRMDFAMDRPTGRFHYYHGQRDRRFMLDLKTNGNKAQQGFSSNDFDMIDSNAPQPF